MPQQINKQRSESVENVNHWAHELIVLWRYRAQRLVMSFLSSFTPEINIGAILDLTRSLLHRLFLCEVVVFVWILIATLTFQDDLLLGRELACLTLAILLCRLKLYFLWLVFRNWRGTWLLLFYCLLFLESVLLHSISWNLVIIVIRHKSKLSILVVLSIEISVIWHA